MCLLQSFPLLPAQYVTCLSIPLTFPLTEQEFSVLMNSNLPIIPPMKHAFGGVAKVIAHPRPFRFSPVLSSRSVIILKLTFDP